MKKVAIVGFTNPFVNNSDGGKIDTLNRIKSLNEFTNDIDVYTLLKKDEKEDLDKGVKIKNIYTDKIENKLINLIKNEPISVINRYSQKLISEIENQNNRYDIAIYENYNMYRYVDSINSKIHCLRVHNIESLSRRELFKATLPKPKALAEYLEAIKYSNVERKCLSRFDYFLFISKDEMNYMTKKFPIYKEKFIWMPPVTDINPVKENLKTNQKEILYYGDMTVSHNIRGLKWYVENVFIEVTKKEKCKLNVIGKISIKDKEYLSRFSNVDILGYVDDLDEYISKAHLVIAPIFTGAGVKIKVINTLSKGKVLLTTTKGIEGTSFENGIHLLVADSKEESIDKTIEVLNNPVKFENLKQNSIYELEKLYSISSQANIIKSLK